MLPAEQLETVRTALASRLPVVGVPGTGRSHPTKERQDQMYSPTVIGVDPGLVHTGIVMLDFNIKERQLTLDHRAVDGLDSVAARHEVETMTKHKPYSTLDIFIEWYRPRSGFSVDERMVQANSDFKRDLGGNLLRNTGVKKVVTQELMQLTGVWSFSTSTHHQDLRSAARIALLGMMLDPALNKVLYIFATDNSKGRTWNVKVN